ncbi:MAG: GDSL-type esterase/lipase family protein, partial [Bacteroidota bacterium]
MSKANDSDVVNNLRPYKVVVLGSSTAYGTGASTYDSSWVGKYQQYLKNKNPLNEVINLAIPGITTYNNLRPDYYTAPSGRPSTIYGNNITAAMNMHPDAIIINMPSNDAVNYYTIDEQKANVETAIYLADSAHIPVWITTSQPRNNLNAVQMSLLTEFRDWVLTRFGNKSVNFWSNIANANGSITDFYAYDAVHVNNFGHELFYSRMKAACLIDSITSRQLNISAGNDTTLFLPNNQFVLHGNGISLSNSNINYSWKKIAGPSLFTIQNENQMDASITNLVEGNYSFELSAVDSLLNTKKDTINIIVKTRVLIDFGPTTTTGADINGNYWNNVTSGTEGIKLQNAVTTNNLITPLGLQIVNRIDGLFNVSGQGVNTVNTIGDVGDYPNSVTTDYAFAYFNTVMGKWKITGLDSLKEYSVKFWGTRNATDVRIIEIKRADESVFKSYEAANNTNYNNAAIFTIRGKSEMTFDIKTPANSSFGHICLLDITRRTPADITNLPPTANAGNDVIITLPINTVQLDGNQSFDNDQTITTFEWRKISGPLVYTLTNSYNAVANASGLEVGVYKFELKVTDSEGGTDLDTVVVSVGDRILIDFGNTITSSPDANGKYWNNVSSGTEGVKLNNSITVGNATTNISLEVISRIDGTFNTTGPGVNTGNTTGAVNEYPNSATTDYAFAHPSTTNGAWKISGLDSSKNYSIKFWGTRSVSDNREIEIKTSEDSIWKSYNSANNANYNNAVIIDIYGKSSVVFNIRVKTGSAFGYIGLIDINYSKPCIVTNSTTNTSICKSQLPYTWNNKNYNAAGSYNAFLINSNGCDSVATLNLIVNDSSSSVSNISICANQTPFIWNGNSYNTSGTYSVTRTNAKNCDSIASLNLTINNTSSSITDATVCANQSPYVWNGNNYSTSGVYSVMLVNANGCDSIATLNLVVNDLSESTTIITICINQTPYVWNGNNYSTSGNYSVTLANANGCDSVATLNLTVNNISSSVANIIICSNQTPFVWNGNNYSTSGNYSVTLA